MCWGIDDTPWGPPATLADDSTEALPLDLNFAASAGKVVLASLALSPDTQSPYGTMEAVGDSLMNMTD